MSARALARGQGDVATHRYLFAQPYESGTAIVRALGAFHGLELAWVFQHADEARTPPSANELAVERALLGYWTRFAATGDPNGGSELRWGRYAAGEPLLRIGSPLSEERGWRNAECDFVDTAAGISNPAPR
jgi:para-nitrobenzyl esterase